MAPGRILILAACAASVGCWEEIRYVPPPEAPADRPAHASLQPAAPSAMSAEATPPAPTADPAAPPPAGDAPQEPAGGEPSAAESLVESLPDDAATPAIGPAHEDESVLPTPPEMAQTPPATEPPDPAAAAEPDALSTAPEAAATDPLPVAQQRSLVWQAASKWSFAAALFAKEIDANRYEPIRAEAVDAARRLGVELPPLPAAAPANREADVIAMLRTAATDSLLGESQSRFTAAEAALARLAVRSHLLLLTYSPRLSGVAQQAAALRADAETSDLPAELWQPLATLLDGQAEYPAVKAAVFELHRRTALHLNQAAEAE